MASLPDSAVERNGVPLPSKSAAQDILLGTPPPLPPELALTDLKIHIVRRKFVTDQLRQLSIYAGERLLLLHGSIKSGWIIAVNFSEEVGWVPLSHIDMELNNLDNSCWFHWEMLKEDVKNTLLKQHVKVGSFLVWQNYDKQAGEHYFISVNYHNQVFHHSIETDPQTLEYYLTPKSKFQSLPDLVDHYSKYIDGILNTALLHPVVNVWEKLKQKITRQQIPSLPPPLKANMADTERRRSICERVLRAKALVTIIVVIFNYLGLPRSGKTSLRRRITGEIENIRSARQRGEIEQPSTGVVEDGGQVLIKRSCQEMGTIRSKIWSVVKSLGDEANILSQLFYRVDTGRKVESPKPTSFHGSSVLPNTSLQPTEPKKKHLRQKKSPGKKSPSPKIAEEEDEMFAIIKEAMETEHWEEIKDLLEDTILLVNNDTGGHAEFLDLQAALIQGPSFNLFFSRLVDDLDSLFKIYYTNEEGVSTDKEDSTMTVEEVMYQALASIACFSGVFSAEDDTSSEEVKKSQSKVMFVGTHRDMVSEEEFEEKDEDFRAKIESTEFYKKGIIEYASEDQLMIAVNNLTGNQDEIEKIRKILEKVIEESFVKISIPAAWLVLSLYLRKKKFRTVSLTECEELAGKLGMDPEELQDALWFLHHRVGVLLYYPEVEAMRDTVICQMQVVFDSASNLIRNTFTFDKVGQYVSKEFREKGQFSLKDVKKATSGHTDSLIPLEKLVMLLQHLNVLTPIIPSTPSSSGKGHHIPEPTYFMPCVLQSARAGELKISSSSAQDPAPLMLRYECGYTPVGVFPSMITNLVSQQLERWEMIEEGLCKNKVQFFVGEDYDTVTLISHPRFFEIAITRTKGFDTPTESLCSRVRGVIQSTLDTVTSRMNYRFSMGYKFGFECPAHPGREHLCVLAREGAKRMECLQNPKKKQPIPLEAHHQVWFKKDVLSPASQNIDHEAKSQSFPSLEKPSLKSLTLLKWCDEHGQEQTFQLASKVNAKWRDFGILLGLELNELDGFDSQYHGNPTSCWNKVMSRWLAGGGGRDYPTSWEGLYILLEDMEFSKAAKELKLAVSSGQ